MDLMKRAFETVSMPAWNLTVAMHSITAAPDHADEVAVATDMKAQAAISRGGLLAYFPNATTEAIWAAADARGYENFTTNGSIPIDPVEFGFNQRVPCDANLRRKGSLKLRLGGACGPEIAVPFDDLVVEPDNINDPTKHFQSVSFPGPDGGKEVPWCVFGIRASLEQSDKGGDEIVLSGAIARHMYTVYDMANMEVAIAKRKEGATASKWVAFEKEGAKIPRAVKLDPTAKQPECKPADGAEKGVDVSGNSGRRIGPCLVLVCTVVFGAVIELIAQ
jgi:aspartyl protease